MSDILRQFLTKPAPSGARSLPPNVQAALAGDPQAARYAEGALRRACENIAYAPNGTRNHTLNAESWSIGQLVKAGHLDWATTQDRLWEAAQACGLPEVEIERTIPRAIKQAEARDVQLDPTAGAVDAPNVTFQPQPPPAPQQDSRQAQGADNTQEQEDAPTPEEQQAQAAELMLERNITIEMERLAVQEEARRRFAQKQAAEQIGTIPPPATLTDFLAVEDPPIHWLLEGLQPAGTRALLAAQAKAGKTTMVANLIKALADQQLFLGEFRNHFTGTITLIDDELDDRMLRRWLRNLNITNTDRIRVVTLRGRLQQFNIVDEHTRHIWSKHLAGTDYLILDCLRPVLDACGLDENREAGIFLNAFDALLEETGIDSGLVVHHMGHSASRSRGDSRIMDWPDALWKLTREDTENPASKRHFSAFGREVDVKQQPLHYTGGRLALNTDDGTRRVPYAQTPEPWIIQTLYLRGGGQAQAGKWFEEQQDTAREAGQYAPSRAKLRDSLKALVDKEVLTLTTIFGGKGYALNPDHADVQALVVSD